MHECTNARMNRKIPLQQQDSSMDDAVAREWDAIVVGGGMGGAASAYKLAQKGFDVLLVEKGMQDPHRIPIPGRPPEDPMERLQNGLWPDQLEMTIDNRSMTTHPTLGCGIGGSTLLYAASLGRLEATDFEPRTVANGELRDWPFTYAELEPYYLETERLFEVSGTCDPLNRCSKYSLLDPPAMGNRDRHIFDSMRSAGLHPYRIHNAIRYTDNCDECAGRVCITDCKGDAKNRLAKPAMASGRVLGLYQTDAVSVEATANRATGLKVTCAGREAVLRGRAIVLCAGSLATPALLQRSVSETWRNGVGNHHDLVGRNLMFHASDFVAVWPRANARRSGPSRTIALRDFYQVDDQKLGEFQSMGLEAGYGEILTFLHQRFDQSPLHRLPILRELLRIPAFVGSKLFREASVFTTIVEDDPYLDNRVILAPGAPSGFKVEYQTPGELKDRVLLMRRMLKDRLKNLRLLVINQDVALNFGHACGTCRAGSDPATSVVDKDCRVHDISNLYVADGSFMPTSGGTNPSLTIAANALRVADAIAERLRGGEL